jgi:chromate transporter
VHYSDNKAPSFIEALKVWVYIGLLSFGGPAAQVALMHRVLVEEKKWLTEKQYLDALSFCMLLPGPEAMQLATYAGWRMHGVKGGLAAGLMFVIPGSLVILGLAMAYMTFGQVTVVASLFVGIKAAIVVVVIDALLRISHKTLKTSEHWLIALFSFISIFFFTLPFPLVVFLVACYGYFGHARFPSTVHTSKKHRLPPVLTTIKTAAFWLSIWLMPLLLLTLLVGSGNIILELGWFFSKLALVTFGGAYAVLAYMAQDVVVAHQWLTSGQMMDGLGLAETTPGPLILVTEFVGYLAAYQSQNSWILGLAGAFIALWCTFVPCLMWIFTGAPYIEWINNQPKLKGALTAIMAAVVGVILNLSIWFALHVFFQQVSPLKYGLLTLWLPQLSSLDASPVILALLSAWLLLKLRWKIPKVLATAALGAFCLAYIGL